MKRWPALVLVVAVLVGAVVYDRRPGSDGGVQAADAQGSATDLPTADDIPRLMPQGLPGSAAGSTWYCAGGTATGVDPSAPAPAPPPPADLPAGEVPPVPEIVADHVVVVANTTDRALEGVLTAYPSEGDAVTYPIEVGARARISVRLADLLRAPYAAATVEMDGGGVVVEHEVSGPLGLASAPCASSASSAWFFAGGSTERGASEVLVFFNPFPSDAVVDVSFATDQGARNPRAFEDLPIPAHSVRAVPVTDKVTIREVVSASVVVRLGRLVVDRIQTWDGTPPPDEPDGEGEGDQEQGTEPAATTTTTTTAPPGAPPPDGERPPEAPPGEEPPEERPPEDDPDQAPPPAPEAAPLPPVTRKGLALSLGVPRAAVTWLFPDGVRTSGASMQYVVYNPTDRRAQVELQVNLVESEKNGSIDPIDITVAPGAVEVFDIDDDIRVPLDIDFSATVTSFDDVPVVVEQVRTGRLGGADGAAVITGSPLVADHWQFASGSANVELRFLLVLLNPGDRAATVQVATLDGNGVTPLPGAEAIEVPPGARVRTTVNDAVQGDQVLVQVTADRPIVVQRVQQRIDATGFTASIGVPLPGDVALP